MNESIFKIKQQKFRERIRKSKIEEMFRLKRNMASLCTYNDKLYQIYLHFQTNFEIQSKLTIQCDEAMQQLICKNNTHDNLLLLANLCATQNSENSKKLVEKFKLQEVFLEILQQQNSFSWQIEYALQGLINLLLSDFESQQNFIMLLDSNLITIIIRIKQKIDEKLEIQKETLLKLISVVLFKISYLNCQNHITKPQLIDIFNMNLNWISECQEQSCLNIILTCQYIEGLLGLISDSKFLDLLNLVKITYVTQRNLTLRIIIMINTLMTTFDAKCNNCTQLIKKSTIQEFLIMVFSDNQQIDELLIEHCLLFLNDILSCNIFVSQQCLELHQSLIKLAKNTESLTILLLCSDILQYFIDKQTFFQSNYQDIIQIQFNVLRNLNNQEQEEGVLMILENLLKFCEGNCQQFDSQQIEYLEKLRQSNNENIREVASSILFYEFNNL